MKAETIHRPVYPNAASRRQILHKIVDTLLIAAIGGGLAAMTLLILAL